MPRPHTSSAPAYAWGHNSRCSHSTLVHWRMSKLSCQFCFKPPLHCPSDSVRPQTCHCLVKVTAVGFKQPTIDLPEQHSNVTPRMSYVPAVCPCTFESCARANTGCTTHAPCMWHRGTGGTVCTVRTVPHTAPLQTATIAKNRAT